MFTAILICSDEVCDHADEFVGALEELDAVLCEGCDCLMQVVAIEGADEAPVVLSLVAARARPAGAPLHLAA